MEGLYETETFVQVLFVTGILGGGAAWATGQAIADTWRPYRQLAGYMILLGGAVRFAHFALFDATLLSVPSYLADMFYLLAVGSVSWRMTRARRMVSQYGWLYERSGPFTWRERVPPASGTQEVPKNSPAWR
ncbi:MAG: hypothetical protein IT539_01065 [Bradyrhizobiaceae bacterium]|nr:hypothetical protein [Bradyrhizobiaceae bacterium]